MWGLRPTSQYKIIHGLAQVPFECVLIEAYNSTRRQHNMIFRQIVHTTSQYGQSFPPKTISAWNGLAFAETPPLAVLTPIFFIISVHPFRIIPKRCPAEYRNRLLL